MPTTVMRYIVKRRPYKPIYGTMRRTYHSWTRLAGGWKRCTDCGVFQRWGVYYRTDLPDQELRRLRSRPRCTGTRVREKRDIGK